MKAKPCPFCGNTGPLRPPQPLQAETETGASVDYRAKPTQGTLGALKRGYEWENYQSIDILAALEDDALAKEVAAKCDREWCSFDGSQKIIEDYRAAIFERIGRDKP